MNKKNKIHGLINSFGDDEESWKEVEERSRGISLNDLFSALSNRRRRYVISYLMENENVKLSRMATQIAAWEIDKELNLVKSQERKRVYISLYQSHLPKLDEFNIIDYNQKRGEIEEGEEIQTAYKYMEFERSNK